MTTKQFLILCALLCGGVFAIARADYPTYSMHGRLEDSASRLQTIVNNVGNLLIPPGGRLTLQSHTPVMTTNAVTATVIYYDSYVSNQLPIFNGTKDFQWAIPSNEISMNLSATNMLAVQVFDVFAMVSNGSPIICIPTDGSGHGWSSDSGGSTTARGTGYSKLDRTTRPYYTNANQITHCFGGAAGNTDFGPIPANQGTYLGTIYNPTNGSTDFIPAVSGTGGGSSGALVDIWNYYNRVNIVETNQDSGGDYAYTSVTIREARGSTSFFTNQVIGVAEDTQRSAFDTSGSNAVAGASQNAGLGFDQNTAFQTGSTITLLLGSSAAIRTSGTATFWLTGWVGLHTMYALEESDGTNANNFNLGNYQTLSLQTRY